jgi:hypothetical protein
MNMIRNNVGILIFGDPTRGGTILSEVKFLKNLQKTNPDCNFYLLTVNPSVTKRVIKEGKTTYDFPNNLITIFGEDDFHKLDNLSCIVTYPGHSNFFGGYLNDNIVKMYKIISKCTNTLKIPVFIRINDSEIKVRDYRLMSLQRLDAGKAARLEGKPDNAFMKDPVNVGKAEDLVSWKEWDYTRIYWFANGSRDACDWVAETMFDREDPVYRMASRETFVTNAIYVSDDIFFLVSDNYERFKNYDLLAKAVTTGQREPYVKDQFCYIGFFDTVNMARGKVLQALFKKNEHHVDFKIFGKGTEILVKLKAFTNIQIEEGYIQGDSQEYFDFLNSHLAYLFIGKGQSHSRYIGKTVYDAIVARTPVAVYKKCDEGHITFKSDEYYFSNESELKAIQVKLNDPAVRDRWIKDQAAEIFGKLPPSEFRFSTYCVMKAPLSEELHYVPLVTVKASKQPKGESIKTPTKTPALTSHSLF